MVSRRKLIQKNAQTNNRNIDNVLRGAGFETGKEGPELYARTIERLGLYASTQFKNGADEKKCLMARKSSNQKIPELADNHTAHKKSVWDHWVTKIMKTKCTLENNLHNLFAVLMSLCDFDSKNQIKNMTKWK